MDSKLIKRIKRICTAGRYVPYDKGGLNIRQIHKLMHHHGVPVDTSNKDKSVKDLCQFFDSHPALLESEPVVAAPVPAGKRKIKIKAQAKVPEPAPAPELQLIKLIDQNKDVAYLDRIQVLKFNLRGFRVGIVYDLAHRDKVDFLARLHQQDDDYTNLLRQIENYQREDLISKDLYDRIYRTVRTIQREIQRHIEDEEERRRKQCNNTDTITGEDVIDISRKTLYISPSGNCFDINDDITPMLLGGTLDDPYSRTPLWKDFREFKRTILEHPGLTAENRTALRVKFTGVMPVEIARVIFEDHIDVFNLIGKTGIACYSDYTDDFRIATEALGHLMEEIRKLPAPAQEIMFNLNNKRGSTVKYQLENSSASCIHGVGSALVRIYMIYLSEFNPEVHVGIPPPRPIKEVTRVADRVDASYVSVCTSNKHYAVLLYIHDFESHGAGSEYGLVKWFRFRDGSLQSRGDSNITNFKSRVARNPVYEEYISMLDDYWLLLHVLSVAQCS